MSARARLDLDVLLRDLMNVGFGMLLAWSLTGAVGLMSRRIEVDPHAALRFLLAILVVVFARRTYWEVREWWWRRVPAAERYGFASPLWETPRAGERRRDTDVAGPSRIEG